MISLNDYALSFTEYMQLLHLSEQTIKLRLWCLKKFFLFCESHQLNDIRDITEDHIKEYRRFRHYYQNRFKRNDSPRVQNRHLISIKMFFRYLKKEGFIVSDPAEDIPYAKEPKKLPKAALNNKEMKKLLRQPDKKTVTGYRDRTILELLYSTGIRRSEILNLKLDNVDYDEGYLRINQGKGNKDRVVPIGKIACHYLETYIKGIRPLFAGANKTEVLFLGRLGKTLSRNGLADMIAKYAKRSGLEKHISTHTFRRSCATGMIKNKANIMHVKDMLGHNCMETIQKYCHLTIVDLKEEHKKCHPREKDEK